MVEANQSYNSRGHMSLCLAVAVLARQASVKATKALLTDRGPLTWCATAVKQ
jgi:hypothetical protein